MEIGERIKQRKIFFKWKERTKKKIYPLISKFFSQSLILSNEARIVGRIVDGLNNPYFEFSPQLNPLEDTDIIAKRIILQLDVEDFYKLMKKKFGSVK